MLVSDYDYKFRLVDAFLRVLRNPAFALSDLSFRDAVGVGAAISQSRRNLALRRFGSWPFHPLRIIIEPVIELIAEQIEGEADLRNNVISFCVPKQSVIAYEKHLKNISLVHRSWTPRSAHFTVTWLSLSACCIRPGILCEVHFSDLQ